MGRYPYGDSVPKRRRGSAGSSEHWLVSLVKHYYERNKPAILAVGLVLLPICIRLLLPSVEISSFVMLPVKESMPQVWNVMQGWLTPPMLFLLLNLVIGTIAVTSGRGPSRDEKKGSSNLQGGVFEERIEEEEEEEEEEEVKRPMNPPLVEPPNPAVLRGNRRVSYVGESKSQVPTMIKVSEVPCTEDLASSGEVEDSACPDGPSTEELNAKAEDFIQKFKHQLKLQRLESYKERRGKHPAGSRVF